MVKRPAWEANIFDLIAAYGALKARAVPTIHVVSRRPVMTLEAALELVARMLGQKLDWADLASFLPEAQDEDYRRSAIASSFVAALELAKQGRLALRQEAPFAPLMVKRA